MALPALRYDPFQPSLFCALHQLNAILHDVVGIANVRRWSQEFSQQFFALFERNIAQIVAIAVQQIEDVISHRTLLLQGQGRIRNSEARLYPREVRSPFLIENYNLAIENRLARV